GARAVGAGGHDLGANRQHGGRMVVGRIAVRQVAAYRGQVTHQRVGDHGGSVDQDLVPGAHDGRRLQRRLAHQRADPQHAALLFYVVEPGDAVDVDQVGGTGE